MQCVRQGPVHGDPFENVENLTTIIIIFPPPQNRNRNNISTRLLSNETEVFLSYILTRLIYYITNPKVMLDE